MVVKISNCQFATLEVLRGSRCAKSLTLLLAIARGLAGVYIGLVPGTALR